MTLRPPLIRSGVTMQEGAAAETFNPKEFAQSLPGITSPLGFFDPMGFCSDKSRTEGRIRFYREVEIKHARVAMLAALGFPVAEQWHPLFKTDDAPSFTAFQETPLQIVWPFILLGIGIVETFSIVPAFENPVTGKFWQIRKDHLAGDLEFDPLQLSGTRVVFGHMVGLRLALPEELAEMQTKELNNGRLAMMAIAGMVVQEGVSGGKLF